MALRKLLLLPQLMWYGVRAPRDQSKAWDRYWAGIERTGSGGHVLWDAAAREELDDVLARVLARMDKTLPMVDLGCGNGRFARLFAPHFPRVVGIDVSPHAVERARMESRDIQNVSFRVLDASVAGAGKKLAEELGEVNVYMRGVFHVFDAAQRKNAVQSLADMTGKRGVVYCAETNYEGDPLDQLVAQGATATTMPEPLRKCIEAGIKPPRHFGEPELVEFFPKDRWETLESGPTTMRGVTLTAKEGTEPIPSFYAVVRQQGGNA
jgi:SAM-dependent methyltransferase